MGRKDLKTMRNNKKTHLSSFPVAGEHPERETHLHMPPGIGKRLRRLIEDPGWAGGMTGEKRRLPVFTRTKRPKDTVALKHLSKK